MGQAYKCYICVCCGDASEHMLCVCCGDASEHMLALALVGSRCFHYWPEHWDSRNFLYDFSLLGVLAISTFGGKGEAGSRMPCPHDILQSACGFRGYAGAQLATKAARVARENVE